MIRRAVAIAAALGGVLSSVAAAQAVDLTLREEGSRAPVTGAIVRLLGERGVVAQGLTSESGRLLLRAPVAGSYRLRIDRIGWSGLLTDPLELIGGETRRLEMPMASRRVDLPTLVVTGKSRCTSREGGGPLAAALWEEIRKALTANLLTQESGAAALYVQTFEREVNRSGQIVREWPVGSTLVRGQPFHSLAPDSLARAGFVLPVGDSTMWAAPDAGLLLSDEFVATHCFRAVAGEEPLIGLAFQPVRGRRVADVLGTLWVDRTTSELKFLEYSYTSVPRELNGGDAGGRVEFRRLPAGAWIVSYWHIRMPRLESLIVDGPLGTHRRVVSLIGYVDQGGRADLAGTAQSGRRAVLTGRVTDSLAGEGLAGAVIRVRGVPDSAITDRSGRFVLAVDAAGEHEVVASHPRLGLLGDAAGHTVLLSPGDSATADFAVPPLASFVRSLCGAPGTRSGVVGIASGADGKPAEYLEVLVAWVTPSGSREERSRIRPGGLYALCDLAAGPSLVVRLQDGLRVWAEKPVRLVPGEFRWVELRAGEHEVADSLLREPVQSGGLGRGSSVRGTAACLRLPWCGRGRGCVVIWEKRQDGLRLSAIDHGSADSRQPTADSRQPSANDR